MQSELSCHIGFLGRLFCRVCRVSGKVEADDDDNGPSNGYSSDASVQSQSKGKKGLESMSSMVTRIRDFMHVGLPSLHT